MAIQEEVYEFDLRGYIVLKNVLSKEEVKQINSICDSTEGKENRQQRTGKFSFFELDPPYFLNLMAHPRILGLLRELMGDWFRFDHAFGVEMPPGSQAYQGLHAGPMEEQRVFFYQWANGQMRNGLVKVVYALNDVRAGDGGFVVVAGSHKESFHIPLELDSYLVDQPVMEAGDALIFSEALVHGARKWQGQGLRRVLIYSYAPGYAAWLSQEWPLQFLEFAENEIQRKLLRPPFVGEFDDEALKVVRKWSENYYRPQNHFPYDDSVFQAEAKTNRRQLKDSLHHLKIAAIEVGSTVKDMGQSWLKHIQDKRRDQNP